MISDQQSQTALERAIKEAGGRDALASALGISGPAISQWTRIPAERVLDIERATNGIVSRHDLRADIYPRESDAA